MRKKIMLFFIFLVAIPIITIYSVAISIFYDNTKTDLQLRFSNNIHGVGKNVDRFFTDALDLTTYPLMETNLKAFLNMPDSSENHFQLISNANNILLSMPYGFSNGIRGVSLLSRSQIPINAGINLNLSKEEIEAAKALKSSPYWEYHDVSGLEDVQQEAYNHIFVTRMLKNPSNLSEEIGYIKIAMSRQQLAETILADQIDHDIAYFIVDEANKALVDTKGDAGDFNLGPETSYDNLLQLADREASSTQISGHYYISAHKIERTPFILYSVVKPNILTIIKETLIKGLSLTALLVFIFALLLSVTFSQIITAPLVKLGKRMKSITNEDFSVRIDVKRNDELSVLANNFNRMAERLDFLYKEVYMSRLNLQQAQLHALQAQINPHFLYNTLDTIYWMSEMGDTKNVSLMVSNMSKMMRLTLSPNNRDMVQLSEELEHLSSYINIQRIRYGDQFVFEIDCPEDLKSCYVLRLLLQPLVENALVHGLKDSTSGMVKVKIYPAQNTLIYEVMNDGTPADVAEIKRLLEEEDSSGIRGFALRNIRERLALKNGHGFHLDCYVRDGITVFQITQKLRKDADGAEEELPLPDGARGKE
ncbi:sensor histidine kinase [Paenibacillus sp. NPDC058174]|uniref:sensor histidine kinase n=1 Tax=Paenibacillus sp. NPDC058174 TaxID=3346366 RepID=UPI0036D7C148